MKQFEAVYECVLCKNQFDTQYEAKEHVNEYHEEMKRHASWHNMIEKDYIQYW